MWVVEGLSPCGFEIDFPFPRSPSDLRSGLHPTFGFIFAFRPTRRQSALPPRLFQENTSHVQPTITYNLKSLWQSRSLGLKSTQQAQARSRVGSQARTTLQIGGAVALVPMHRVSCIVSPHLSCICVASSQFCACPRISPPQTQRRTPLPRVCMVATAQQRLGRTRGDTFAHSSSSRCSGADHCALSAPRPSAIADGEAGCNRAAVTGRHQSRRRRPARELSLSFALRIARLRSFSLLRSLATRTRLTS